MSAQAGPAGLPLVSSDVDATRLVRAKGYPYRRPSSSFLYVDGTAHTFRDNTWRGPHGLEALQLTAPSGAIASGAAVLAGAGVAEGWAPTQQWTPVLAIGSNAGPGQLARKYPPDLFPHGVVVPVVRSVLTGFDVVYAPLITSYGSCSATLEAAPGTDVELFVTFLTPALLQRMHETEGAYLLCRLSSICLHLGTSLESHRDSAPCAGRMTTVYQYNHQAGCLHVLLGPQGAASPVALQEIRALGRRLPALPQMGMQRANLNDEAARKARVDALIARAKPFSYARSEVLQALGSLYAHNVA
ncbi:hypothetical protein WJX81_001870 [Elliptochloris bilobata]|uniref:Uncharacterized protein n=1 Tax=Elliptochloris bilobata TaxID=381761 RepID=A0AAW1RRS8_9CHLO